MTPLTIYCSLKGHTRTAAQKLNRFACCNIDNNPPIEQHNPILILCPTYGDEELPLPMEDYLQNLTITGKEYGICELGNYYGFDDEQFGALAIIKHELDALQWKNVFPNLSLDSLPKVDWDAFNSWKKEIYELLKDASQSNTDRI